MPEENKEKLHIRLHVYDTDMTVNIPREDEELYRSAAKLISETINRYASYYDGRKSEKEILYMALIDIALQLVREQKNNDVEPFVDILGKLTSEIENTLKDWERASLTTWRVNIRETILRQMFGEDVTLKRKEYLNHNMNLWT